MNNHFVSLDVKSLQICLELGDDVDRRDVTGQTALMITARRGFVSCVELLLAQVVTGVSGFPSD